MAVVDDDRLLGIVKWVSIVRGLAGQDPEEAPAGAQQHAGGAPGEPEREAATAG